MNVTQIYWDVVRANAKTKLNFSKDLIMACMELLHSSLVIFANKSLYLVMED